MNFIDKVLITLIAGRGGNGKLSFRHVIYNTKGGPDGGDGGHGGNIIFIASRNQNTLSRYRYQKILKAKDGSNGLNSRRHGKNGADLILNVPIGTVITDLKGNVLADLVHDNQQEKIAEGGNGGFGNAHFVSSRRQAPNFAESGETGDQIDVQLELKMIADVGLIGLPNAGKSTLLASVSNAHPEIADYPFTTLTPHLGVADISKDQSILLADIPGLIEGAADGKGLGHDFLRHIERTSVLLHLIDIYDPNPTKSFITVNEELKAYEKTLLKTPQIIALTKIDGVSKAKIDSSIKNLKKVTKKEVFAISALSKTGLDKLLYKLYDLVKIENDKLQKKAKKTIPTITLPNMHEKWHVIKQKNKFIVTGQKIEKFAAKTDFANDQALNRLKDIMKRQGIFHELNRKNIKSGQTIQIGEDENKSFDF